MRSSKLIASLATTAAASLGLAFAGDEMTSLSYISYLERYATVQPVDGKAADAVVNMPVISGDRLDTARGARVEVQLADGGTLWIDEFTTVDFDALAASRDDPARRTVLFLQEGTAALEIPATALGEESVRFDYPNGSLFLSKPGLYRFDLRSGSLHVQAHAGLAELPAGIGSALLRTGQEAWLSGQENVATVAITAQADDFWSWVQERRNPAPTSRTAETVGTTTSGRTAALDSYGTWVYVDGYSTWAWRPYVQTDWSPYRHGRWYWTPVGWNWISYEPWGWYPYHYGSWFWEASVGWLWCWDMVWGPAWVHWIYTPGYIGWCPRGYYDWWYDRHGHRYGGGHGGGYDRARPGRWSEVAYDLSGRVRLRDVDQRPWNMVPAGQFTNERLDRVRVEPGRVLTEAGEGAHAWVRSGPLVTAPSRGDVERSLEGGLRGRGGAAGDDDLGGILRRDDQPARSLPAGATVRAVRTADLVASAPRRADAGTGEGSGAVRSAPAFTPGDRPMVDASGGGRRGGRTTRGEPGGGTASAPATSREPGGDTGSGAVTRGGATGGTAPAAGSPGGAPATTPRSPARPAGGGSATAPRSRTEQPRSGGGSTAAPAPASPAPASPAPEGGSAAPAPARKPGYTARVRSYEQRVPTSTRSRTLSGGDATVTERTYVVPFAGGRRVVQVTTPSASPSGASSPRVAAPYVPRQYGGTATGSAPAQGTAPRAGRASQGYQGRTYQAAPRPASAPRAAAPPAASAPRQASPSSGSPAPRSASPSGSSSSRSSGASGGGRPAGRR